MNLPTVAVPPRLDRRPRDRHGRIVPWFVAYLDNGEPDHRLAGPDRFRDAVRLNLCILCGEGLGSYKAFCIGPMCTINRVTAEPPAHKDCAEYAPKACPFLLNPNMRRRDKLPENTVPPDGIMCPRNPGISVVWTTRRWTKKPGYQLFDLGEPTEVTWWREGRPATYGEALDSLLSGLDVLKTEAANDADPERAQASLQQQYERAVNYLPGNAT